MSTNAIRCVTAVTAITLSFGCAAGAATSDVPTMRQGHMEMTVRQPQRPGDRARANAIVAAARRVMAEYPTVQAAQAAGFKKFLPRIPLPLEHYTNRQYALEAWRGTFDPMHPTSLIFQRNGAQLDPVGVMYTAANSAGREQLDRDVPLSFATWHRHVDFCRPPIGAPIKDWFGADSRFGMQGSIDAADACAKAGGTFVPVVFGWMVHVWPNEKTQAGIWAVDRDSSMERGTM